MNSAQREPQTPTYDEILDRVKVSEDDWKMERHISDEQMRADMAAQCAHEKQIIRADLERGRVFVIAGKDQRRVHAFECSSLRDQTDRDRAWASWLAATVESVRREHAQGNSGPKMPELASRAEVEALSSYVPCQTCAPLLDHTVKKRARPTTKLSSLSQRHIGRTITTLDGQDLGLLRRILITIDEGGMSVTIETSAGTLSGADSERVLVGPGPTAG